MHQLDAVGMIDAQRNERTYAVITRHTPEIVVRIPLRSATGSSRNGQ
jgi:hypothetical protein